MQLRYFLMATAVLAVLARPAQAQQHSHAQERAQAHQPAPSQQPPLESPHQPDCQLVWADEFDYDGLPDTTKWRYDVGGHGWGNDELQFYTSPNPEHSDTEQTNPEEARPANTRPTNIRPANRRPANARVEGGRLIIEARKEEPSEAIGGREYTSARLLTKEEWTYGRFEARAKLPSGRGTWPAIWMLPDLQQYGGWPLGGEIDVMEHVGHDPDVVHSTVHTGAYNHTQGTHRGERIEVPTARSGFNLYAVEWTPEEIRGYVNDTHYFTFENETLADPAKDERHWPFDHPFHLILNVAVGGAWGGQQGVDPDIWPQRMEVEYVRVYDCFNR